MMYLENLGFKWVFVYRIEPLKSYALKTPIAARSATNTYNL